MDYNAKLEQLIHEYELDIHHPGFYESLIAKKLLANLWASVRGGRLLLLSDKRGDFEAFRVEMPEDIAYISYIYDNSALLALNQSAEEIKKIEADIVLLITYKDHVRVSAELARNHIKAIDLYDYFIEHGLELNHEYYQVDSGAAYFDKAGLYSEDTFYDCNYSMLFYDKRKYLLAESEEMRRYYLEKVIFDCFYMGDFVNGEAFIREYIEKWPGQAMRYQSFGEEVKRLLQEIGQAIKQKEKKDIILYWVDAISYGEDKIMPYLRSLDGECMVFKRAYTTIDTTSGVASSVFCREMPLESRKFKHKELIGDCYLTEYLKRQGWRFRYYGVDGIFAYESVRNIVKDRHISIVSPKNYWLMLCDMAEEDQPAFRIVHVMGCHTPFLSGGMSSEEYLPMHGLFCKQDLDMEKKVFAQRIDAMRYEDAQLAFYDRMVNAVGKIYFSDHGCHSRSGANLAELYHTILKVKSDRFEVGENWQVFSVINLGRIIQYMISGDRKYYDSISGEQAVICALPYYSKSYVKEVYQPLHFNEMIHLGYWGIVKGNNALFLCNCGTELCYEIRDERAFLMGYDQCAKIREALKERLMPEMMPMTDKKAFKYTKVLFDLYERVKERNKAEEQRKKTVVFCRELIKGIPMEERIAIRGGGEDAVMFLDCLTKEERTRIRCVVDNDKQCAANNWGIPVIPTDDIEKREKTTVFIASSKYHTIMAEELKKYDNIEIIDIYERLREQEFPPDRFLSDLLYGKRIKYQKEDFVPVDWEKLERQ